MKLKHPKSYSRLSLSVGDALSQWCLLTNEHASGDFFGPGTELAAGWGKIQRKIKHR